MSGSASLTGARKLAFLLTGALFLYYEVYRWIPLGKWNWQFHFPVSNDQPYPDLVIGLLLLWFAWSFAMSRKVGMWAASTLLTLWVIMHCLDWWIPYLRSLPQNAGRYRFYGPHTQILPAIGNYYPPDAGHAVLDFILFPAWIAVLCASIESLYKGHRSIG